MFQKIGSLEELVLHQNGITAKGIEALADCLVSNPNLRIVNFNDNTATQIGSVALASAIKVLSNLETINFGDCLCRDQGVVDLSGAELSGEAALQIIHKWNRFPNAHLVLSSNNYGGMFGEVRDTVRNINVDIGDSEFVLRFIVVTYFFIGDPIVQDLLIRIIYSNILFIEY
uniref:RNI-like superfamily protein n=1 Tax=Heterorhabditis bacteriophora TaxID=37862 RepID=A0A1I7WEY2_HETBA